MDNKDTKEYEEMGQQTASPDSVEQSECADQNTGSSAQEAEISCEERYKELNDTYLRLMAEFDNYRKRTTKEKLELIRNGGERVIVDILPIVDNFERALKNMETATDINALKQGIELIYQQIISTLKQHGTQAIATENVDFDTEYHEAITTIPAPTEEQKGKIIDCTLKGYTLNDKVIRHSKVVVGE